MKLSRLFLALGALSALTLTAQAMRFPFVQVAQDEAPAKPQKSGAATVLTLGTTLLVELDKDESQDFSIELPAGEYTVLVDGKGLNARRVYGGLSVLKRNGSSLAGFNGEFLSWAENITEWRTGKTLSLKSNLAARLRLKNGDETETHYWLTIVPTTKKDFVPLGYSATIKDAVIGTDEGVGGELEHNQSAYYKAVIPAGKWSISVGAKSAGRPFVNVFLKDARGILLNPSGDHLMINGEPNTQKREEKIITLLKPKTFLIQIWSEGTTDTSEERVTYDLTIEKADN
ncbi:hypothetical protein [Armatimonas sp.]|uniref:hypothetical protein n=1 Tax=Armatimonas sp. TaxID=1872638 RepID=UPI00286B8465|nr:hypothetical protein [Armatimonas sp.]